MFSQALLFHKLDDSIAQSFFKTYPWLFNLLGIMYRLFLTDAGLAGK